MPTNDPILLAPFPRSLKQTEGSFKLRPHQLIRLPHTNPQQHLQSARSIQSASPVPLEITAAPAPAHITLTLNPALTKPESYRLTISPTAITLEGATPAALFYAAQTLSQLLRQYPNDIPAMLIEDAPDFPARGYMQDISRDKVPTMQSLFELVDLLASLKYNQLQLYTEHTFAFRGHQEVWAQASPMTPDQILSLERYCNDRFIDLVPNQNAFGHMDRWLKLPTYQPLAECEDGFTFPWGVRHPKGFSLNPLDPKSLQLVEGLFDELLPHFQSKLFNVGLDETFDLGMGKSKPECDARGKERVYLDFLLKIHSAVTKRGRQMQFWGDIILHKPELIPELPKDLIALEWGYDTGHPFAKDTAAFAASNIPFYVCPGTSSWCSLGGRTHNAIENLRESAACGLAANAIGYLNTDWGDLGHLQYLPTSYPGLLAGAAFSWCLTSNANLQLPALLDLHIFQDSAHVMGQLAVDLGNVYLAANTPIPNGTRYFWSFIGNPDRRDRFKDVTPEEWSKYEQAANTAIAPLDSARMSCPHANLITEEYRNTHRMIRHACHRGQYLLNPHSHHPTTLAKDLRQITAHHRTLWLSRNREGGLQDSTARLNARLAEYT